MKIVIDIPEDVYEEIKSGDWDDLAVEGFCEAVRNGTPKEKTGHWIPVEYPTGVEAFGIKEMTAVELRCSVCGKEVDISDGDFKLCPYCGAKMAGDTYGTEIHN